MKRLFGIFLLLMACMAVNAQVVVTIGEFTGGTIVEKSQADRVVTITVTPAADYYIAKSDIVVVPTVNPDPSSSRGGDVPPLAQPLTLEGDDPQDLSEPRDYTFTVPEGLDAWVKEADFHETVVTNLILDEDVTELDAKLLSAYPEVKTITITYDQDVISLGKCDVSGLVIDVPGNLYNMYKVTEGWDQAKEITSTTGIEMQGVAFGDNNSYDTFVYSEAVKVPMGLNALAVTGVKDQSVIVEEIEDVIPAGMPVLLLSKELKGKDFRTAKSSDKGKEYKSLLHAAPEGGLKVEIGQVFLLYNDVFYFSQAGTIPEGGVYFQMPDEKENGQKDPNAKTRSFLTIGEDDTTGIKERVIVNSEKLATADWYSLDGRRLNGVPTAKGLYIHAGKKVVIK